MAPRDDRTSIGRDGCAEASYGCRNRFTSACLSKRASARTVAASSATRTVAATFSAPAPACWRADSIASSKKRPQRNGLQRGLHGARVVEEVAHHPVQAIGFLADDVEEQCGNRPAG